MAKRPFTFEAAADPCALRRQGWPDKTANEISQFSICVQPWLDDLTVRHGVVRKLISFDNPDDPPDVQVNFERERVGFEITRLVPQEFMHYEKVVQNATKGKNFTVSPSLTGPSFKTNGERVSYAVGSICNGGGWISVTDEAKAWVKEARHKFAEKVRRAGKGTYEYVAMFADYSDLRASSSDVVQSLNQTIQNSQGYVPSLIMLLWTNPRQHQSWLMRKSETMLHKEKKE